LLQTLATGVAGAALASWAARDSRAQIAARPNKLAALPGVKSARCPTTSPVCADHVTH